LWQIAAVKLIPLVKRLFIHGADSLKTLIEKVMHQVTANKSASASDNDETVRFHLERHYPCVFLVLF